MASGAILVVEDERQLAHAVVDALTDAGYIVDHASDGQEALTKITDRQFDLVICDLKMPRMDGKAFHQHLSAAEPKLARRVIFVTGDVAGTDAEDFLQQTHCRWLSKPFRLADLLGTVRDVMS